MTSESALRAILLVTEREDEENADMLRHSNRRVEESDVGDSPTPVFDSFLANGSEAILRMTNFLVESLTLCGLSYRIMLPVIGILVEEVVVLLVEKTYFSWCWLPSKMDVLGNLWETSLVLILGVLNAWWSGILRFLNLLFTKNSSTRYYEFFYLYWFSNTFLGSC